MHRKESPRLTVIDGGAAEQRHATLASNSQSSGPEWQEADPSLEAAASPQAIRSCLDYLHYEARRGGLELPAHLIAVARRALDEVIAERGESTSIFPETPDESARSQEPAGAPVSQEDEPDRSA